MSTSSRLLQLLGLLQLHRGWTGLELAERLEVRTRTVRNDVDRLRGLGYVVQAAPGVGGGYRLRAGVELPPLLLDDEEAVAATIALRSASSGGVRGIEEAALRAAAKLEQVLPGRLRERVRLLNAATVMVPRRTPAGVDADILTAIAEAARDHTGLRFEYRRPGGRSERRRADPQRLVHSQGRWYLLAFDPDRSDWRSFRVDRMVLRTPGGPRFVPRADPAEGAAEFVTRGIEQFTRRYAATIRLFSPAEEVASWLRPEWGDLEAVDERSCLFRTRNDSWESIVLGLGLSGGEFEVVEPVELGDYVATMAARLTRAAAASTVPPD